jgi:hypothetical protein
MNENNDLYIPDCEEFVRGYVLYNQKERLGPIWFEALAIVQENWGNSSIMSKGVDKIIRGWNRFYAGFDAKALTSTIETNLSTLDGFRIRDIRSYVPDDRISLLQLFETFEEALKRTHDNRISTVSVGKALSLFSPRFLPIWDSNIAFAYNCMYVHGAKEYISFMDIMKRLAQRVERCVPINDDRPLLKRLDEYNYSKYTKHWL